MSAFTSLYEQPFSLPWVTAISCSVMAALVFFAGNKYGPGLTYDSVNYLYAGYNLYEKGKLLRPLQSPYIEWPPLYPCIIAVLSQLPGNLLQSVFYFQILIASVTAGLSCMLANQIIRHRLIRLTVYISLTFSTPIVIVNHFVWSESFFLLLIVLQIHLFLHYTKQPGEFVWVLLVINGIMLCMQRQVGAFFIAGGACILLLYPHTALLPKRVMRSLLYILLAAVIPLMLWWIRNYRMQGLLMNDYRDTLYQLPFLAHFIIYNDIFTTWLLPDEIPLWIRICVVYSSPLLLLVIFFPLKKKHLLQQPAIFVLFCQFCCYFLLLFIISFIVTEEIDDRKLAPIYIPSIVLFFGLLDRYLTNLQGRSKTWLMYACLVWTVYPVARTLHNVYTWHYTPRQLPSTQPLENEFKEKLRFTYSSHVYRK